MRVNLPAVEIEVFRSALRTLNEAKIGYVLGGAFGLYHYTGIWRHTKDMDVFVMPEDVSRTLSLLSVAGFDTRLVDRHWLAKAVKKPYFVDIIFGEGNWLRPVDVNWHSRSEAATILDVPTRIAAAEELIWSKAYVAGRERYDGADILHLIQAKKGRLDWEHTLALFVEHWQLLFIYLNLFIFVYPSDRDYVPQWVLATLMERLETEMKQPAPKERICRGPLLDRLLYIHDVEERGYSDPREKLAIARGFDLRDVLAERRWAARKLHEREVHAA